MNSVKSFNIYEYWFNYFDIVEDSEFICSTKIHKYKAFKAW